MTPGYSNRPEGEEMKNAYESEEHFGPDGMPVMRTRRIGPGVVPAIVTLVLAFLARACG